MIFQTEVGDTYAVDGPPGITVMRLAVSHGVPGIEGECGGVLTCATCHVHVDPAWHDRLPPAGESETAMLEYASARCATSRLSCQIRIVPALDGLHVRIPERR